jgi:hypothetical protein
MKHVFVESNWVYSYCLPQHRRKPEAERLLERVTAGDIKLYVPGICLREGADAVRRKCQPHIGDLAEYRRLALRRGSITAAEADFLDKFFNEHRDDVGRDLAGINSRLDELRANAGVDVFALSQSMLERVLDLRTAVAEVSQMKHFDEAILGAVIVRGEALHLAGETELVFCTLDADLHPWDKEDRPRAALEKLYKDAGFVTAVGGVAVRNDFRVP